MRSETRRFCACARIRPETSALAREYELYEWQIVRTPGYYLPLSASARLRKWHHSTHHRALREQDSASQHSCCERTHVLVRQHSTLQRCSMEGRQQPHVAPAEAGWTSGKTGSSCLARAASLASDGMTAGCKTARRNCCNTYTFCAAICCLMWSHWPFVA